MLAGFGKQVEDQFRFVIKPRLKNDHIIAVGPVQAGYDGVVAVYAGRQLQHIDVLFQLRVQWAEVFIGAEFGAVVDQNDLKISEMSLQHRPQAAHEFGQHAHIAWRMQYRNDGEKAVVHGCKRKEFWGILSYTIAGASPVLLKGFVCATG